MLGFIIGVLFLFYIYFGYRFLKKMEDIQCKCAVEKKEFQNLKKWLNIVVGTYVAAFVVVIWIMWAEKNQSISISSILVVILVFLVIINIFRVLYARKMYLFIRLLERTNCECSENMQRELNHFLSLFFIVYKSLYLLILFYLLVHFKKTKSLTKLFKKK